MSEIDLEALAQRVDAGSGTDNRLDVMIEVALFEPNETSISCRPNSAGTKVIYDYVNESSMTYWAEEWTADRQNAASELRARASRLSPPNEVKYD